MCDFLIFPAHACRNQTSTTTRIATGNRRRLFPRFFLSKPNIHYNKDCDKLLLLIICPREVVETKHPLQQGLRHYAWGLFLCRLGCGRNQTSTTTRIATDHRIPTHHLPRGVETKHPLQQGLRLKADIEIRGAEILVETKHPLQQGLRPIIPICELIRKLTKC